MSSFQRFEVQIGATVETLSDGSIKFRNDLKNIPKEFVEIILDFDNIDVKATEFWRFAPFDEMVIESVRYTSTGVLFLASHPIEWINIKRLDIAWPGRVYRVEETPNSHRDPAFRWSQRYSIGISDPRLVGEPDRQPLNVKAMCMCGKEGRNNESCDVCGFMFASFRNPLQPKISSGIKRLSKFRQINLQSSKNGLQWKGNDYGTGLKDALSNDQEIARLVREVGALEIHNFSQEYQGWVIEGGRHCRKIFNSGAYWNMLNKIAQRLLEVDITSLISPGGKDVDEDAHGEDFWAMWGSWFALTITFLLLFHIFIPLPSSTDPAFVGENRLWQVSMLCIFPICLCLIFHTMVFLNPFVPHSLWRSFGSLFINLGTKSNPAKLIGLSLLIYLFIVNFDWLPIPLIEGA